MIKYFRIKTKFKNKHIYRNRYYIAIDFDGTIVEDKFPKIGKIKGKTINELTEYYDILTSLGIEVVIILWTCREGVYLELAEDFCKQVLPERIIPTYYNENPERGHGERRKIYADEYWDDKAKRIK